MLEGREGLITSTPPPSQTAAVKSFSPTAPAPGGPGGTEEEHREHQRHRSRGQEAGGRGQRSRRAALVSDQMVGDVLSLSLSFSNKSFCSDAHAAERRLSHAPQEEEEEEVAEMDARL